MRLFSWVVCLPAVAALLAGPVSAKEWKTVTITLEGAYAPWNTTNADGTLGGFEPELAKVLCARMNVECKLVASDWDGMITALNAGKFDVIMDALAITDERRQVIDFSIPYASTPAGFATAKNGSLANISGTGTTVSLDVGENKGAPAIKALRTALKGKAIGIMTATAYAGFIRDNFGDVADIQEYKTGPERDLDLQAGRIDVGFDDAVYFSSAFDEMGGELVFTGPLIGGPVWGEGEALGLRKSDTDLRDMFNAAIRSALEDGTVRTLSEKYLKTDVTPK
ncbi:transporter substrate-binding domain-containing protein [Radicibacter daui]|uniref:transporter substrate-binding domain-containing protein n=1 Tax=Radicibacter daui TaxID=3064829 RepID=UPI004046FF89